MTKNIGRKLYRPFGPSIGKTIIPNELIDKISKSNLELKQYYISSIADKQIKEILDAGKFEYIAW